MLRDVPSTAPQDSTRQICRLGGICIIESARFVALAVNRNFVTALIFLAITRANVGHITSSRDAAMQHLGLGQLPADAQRVPVSVYALARDLRLPYETVRRHVRKLKDLGVCVVEADGVVAPSWVFHLAAQRPGASNAERAVRDLVANAARSGISLQSRFQPVAHDVTLQATRLSTDYFIDSLKAIAQRLDLDIVTVLILLTVGVMNTEAITDDMELARTYGRLDTIPPDDLRTPISAYAVSKFLMLPYETTRRTSLWLVELGLMARNASGGLTLPSSAFGRPDMMAAFAEFGGLTLEFLGRLAEYGITADTLKDHPTLAESARWSLAAAS
jgi:DNA-binding transcriptional ArsR family regulator